MFSVNHKLRIRIDLSRCASGVRFLRAPWQVWRSIIYGFHTTDPLNIRRKYSGYDCNTKASFCNSGCFIHKRALYPTSQTFQSMKNFVLHFLSLLVSYETCREKKLSDKRSFVRRPSSPIWTQEEMPSAIDSISTRNGYPIIEGWVFVAIAGFSHAFKLLLWRLPKILASFAGEKWDVLWLQQSDESRSTSLVSYSFPLGE